MTALTACHHVPLPQDAVLRGAGCVPQLDVPGGRHGCSSGEFGVGVGEGGSGQDCPSDASCPESPGQGQLPVSVPNLESLS